MFELKSAELETGRQIISIRALPTLKNQLLQEAMLLGITLSQHCENLISTTLKTRQDLASLRLSETEKIKQIEDLKNELGAKPMLETKTSILTDERLLYLFEKLKGKSDSVENAYGEDFKIVYMQPSDLLTAIIYSTKLKQ